MKKTNRKVWLPQWSAVKNPQAIQETRVRSLSQENPLEKGIATYSVFFPGDFLGQRRLGYSPCKDLDMTEVTEHASMQQKRIKPD